VRFEGGLVHAHQAKPEVLTDPEEAARWETGTWPTVEPAQGAWVREGIVRRARARWTFASLEAHASSSWRW